MSGVLSRPEVVTACLKQAKKREAEVDRFSPTAPGPEWSHIVIGVLVLRMVGVVARVPTRAAARQHKRGGKD